MDIQHLGSSFNVDYWSSYTEDCFLEEADVAGCYNWLPAAEREQAYRDAWVLIQTAERSGQIADQGELTVGNGQLADEDELAVGNGQLADGGDEQ